MKWLLLHIKTFIRDHIVCDDPYTESEIEFTILEYHKEYFLVEETLQHYSLPFYLW